MTRIKKITDKQGNDIYLRTHTKAVVDDNGYTAESRLQAMQDEINQKQLELGAIPSDLTPTEDSSNWVTSGGLYNQLNVGDANVEIDLSDYTAVRAFPSNTGNWVCTNDSYLYYGYFIPITSGKSYKIVSNAINETRFAFLKNNTYSQGQQVQYAGNTGRYDINENSTAIEEAPSDAKYLYVSQQWGDVNRTPQKIEIVNKKQLKDSVTELQAVIDELKKSKAVVISPLLSWDYIKLSDGDFSLTGVTYNKYLSTVRYIKTSEEFELVLEKSCYARIFFYDKDFSYLSYSDIDVTAGVSYTITPPLGSCFVKAMLMSDSEHTSTVVLQKIHLIGNFKDDWDTYNQRPSDSGYHRIKVFVNVTNPTCCDSISDSVQDSEEHLVDYGIICLPTLYKNTGEATRLIIYCHGAAVNYSDSVTRFNTQDLEPEYWLAEGYAVMDIEGNPFDNTNEHCYIPQAMDSYIAGYKWAIEHYNLKRDGVFLGGRSMGGGCAILLMRQQCPIPVIANCPNSPAGTMPLAQPASRKNFFASHCGFILPSGFVFKEGYVNSEKQVWLDNWDKWIKHIAMFTMVNDLPVTDEEKSDFIDAMWAGDESRTNLYKVLHATAKCPVKFFGCNQDESCPPNITSKLYYRMLINSGQLTEVRIFNSYKDYSGTGTSAHHYDTQDPALRTTVTTRYGEVMTNVPVVYVEMLQFWRRYEQNN